LSRYSQGVHFRRYGALWLLWAALLPCVAQTAVPATLALDVGPDAAEIRNGTYYNYFFGLSYRLPDRWLPNPVFHPAADGSRINLLLLGSRQDLGEVSILLLRAQALSGLLPRSYLDRMRGDEHLGKFKRFTVGSQEFFRADQESPSSHHRVFLVCFRKEYALTFAVETTNNLADRVEDLVSTAVFSNLPMPPEFSAMLRQRHIMQAAGEHGVVASNTYRNELIGFTYAYPSKWSAVPRGQIQSVLQLANQGFAERPQRSPEELPHLQYLFQAVQPQPSGAAGPSSVLIFVVDLLPYPEIRTPLEALGAVDLLFGNDGQHSRRARLATLGGQAFAAQKIVLSGRDANDIFMNAFVANFVTVVGRSALVLIFRSANETALYRALITVNSVRFDGHAAFSPTSAAPAR